MYCNKMNSRRINRHLRHPGLVVLMALFLLVAGVFCLSDFHSGHAHSDASGHHHPDGKHRHSGDEGQGAESCAICFFHSSSVTSDFFFARLPQPALVLIADMAFPPFSDPASVIVTLWSGRAPPSFSVS